MVLHFGSLHRRLMVRRYFVRLTDVEQVTYLNSVIMPDEEEVASRDGTSEAEELE